jgi:hypothetical protein
LSDEILILKKDLEKYLRITSASPLHKVEVLSMLGEDYAFEGKPL